MGKNIIIHEVGMRDGLQIEKQTVQYEKKVEWIEKIIKSGVNIIQLGSFVHPKKVPQMADTDKLFAEFSKPDRKTNNVIFSGLVLNMKGLERGLACGVDMFCMGVSASETHSMKNTGMSIDEATKCVIEMASDAVSEGKHVQVSVQSAFGCGYEGSISKDRVLNLVSKFLNNGFKNISLADTSGRASPDQVEDLFRSVNNLDQDINSTCHFHNTYGMGLVNAYTAIKAGVKYFETAVSGIGGCPFTKVSGGNVSTEDFVHMLQLMNIQSDINIDSLIDIAKDMSVCFDREMPGIIWKTGKIDNT